MVVKMKLSKNRHAQVTIFIILAIVVIAIIFLVIILTRDSGPSDSTTQGSNAKIFMTNCVKDSILEAVNLIETQGGYVNLLEHENIKFSFENQSEETIAYLCYYQGDYLPCVNQEPVLIEHLKNEIKDYINRDVEFCFDDLTKTLEEQGYLVNVRYRQGDFEVVLQEGRVLVNVNAELTLTKTDESFTERDFGVNIPSKIYDMAVVSQRIINEEVLNCDFDFGEYTQLYKDYEIESETASDQSRIYTIKHIESPEIFRFAVRGCVTPPGY